MNGTILFRRLLSFAGASDDTLRHNICVLRYIPGRVYHQYIFAYANIYFTVVVPYAARRGELTKEVLCLKQSLMRCGRDMGR